MKDILKVQLSDGRVVFANASEQQRIFQLPLEDFCKASENDLVYLDKYIINAEEEMNEAIEALKNINSENEQEKRVAVNKMLEKSLIFSIIL